MKRPNRRSLGVAALLFAAAAAAESPPASLLAAPPVAEVRVQPDGPLTVDDSFVRSFLRVRPGEPYDRLAVGRDVKALLDSEIGRAHV